jgi:hypothetical protein
MRQRRNKSVWRLVRSAANFDSFVEPQPLLSNCPPRF